MQIPLYFENVLELIDDKPPLDETSIAAKLREHVVDISKPYTSTRNLTSRTLLHHAIENGCRVEIIKGLIAAGAYIGPVEIANNNTNTALHVAVNQNNTEILRVLLEKGGSYFIDSMNGTGYSPLKMAVTSNYAEATRMLTDSNACLNRSGSMLHYSIKNNLTPETIRILASKSQNINGLCSDGKTPLHMAATKREVHIIKYLIDYGADVNAMTGDRLTPLHLAVRLPKNDETKHLHRHARPGLARVYLAGSPAVKYLLDAGADARARTPGKNLPLHLAVENFNFMDPEHLDDADAMVIALLERYPGAANERDSEKELPLNAVIKYQRLAILPKMLEHTTTIRENSPECAGYLRMAVAHNWPAGLKYILESWPSDGSDWATETLEHAFWSAIDKQAVDCVDLLVKASKLSLLRSESSEVPGLNGFEKLQGQALDCLERCLPPLQLSWKPTGADRVACRLVELGADPFRPREGNISVFERAFWSQKLDSVQFLSACVRRAMDPSPPGHQVRVGFGDLRVAVEMGEEPFWSFIDHFHLREKPIEGDDDALLHKDRLRSITDKDGWTLDHFKHQARPTSYRNPGRVTQGPTRFVFDQPWLNHEYLSETRFIIEDDGQSVEFKDHRKPMSLRTDHPWPIGDKASFQILVIFDYKPYDQDFTIGIGFSGEFCDGPEEHVGQSTWSAGFQLAQTRDCRLKSMEDGQMVQEGPGPTLLKIGLTVSVTIGCELDFEKRCYRLKVGDRIHEPGKPLALPSKFSISGSQSWDKFWGNLITYVDMHVVFLKGAVLGRKLYPSISHSGDKCRVRLIPQEKTKS